MPDLDASGEPPPSRRAGVSGWETAKSVSTVFSAVAIPVVLALVGNDVTRAVKEREIQSKFVELAVQILRETPNAQEAGLRGWATQVLNEYSGVPFSTETKKALIESTPLPSPSQSPLGDRSKYRSRGYVMLTGAGNYALYAPLIKVDLVANPDQAASPPIAAKILAIFATRKQDQLKQSLASGSPAAARRTFVGGMTGGDSVYERYKAYRAALEQAPPNVEKLSLPGVTRAAWLEVDVPLLLAALREQGIVDKDVTAYALATAEFETTQGRNLTEFGLLP